MVYWVYPTINIALVARGLLFIGNRGHADHQNSSHHHGAHHQDFFPLHRFAQQEVRIDRVEDLRSSYEMTMALEILKNQQ